MTNTSLIRRWAPALALLLCLVSPSGSAQEAEHAPAELGQDWVHALLAGQDASHFPRPPALSDPSTKQAKRWKASVPGALDRLLTALDASRREDFVLAWEQLEAEQLLRWAQFDRVEARVADKPAAKQRVQQARVQTDAGWLSLRLAGEQLLENWPKGSAPPVASDFRRQLGARFAQAAPDQPILGFQALPVRRLQASAPVLPATPTTRPSYESTAGCEIGATQGIHAEVEAPLHAEILAKASELGFEYTRIYDFVRTQIDTEWYAGSQRGALGVLRSGRGNDVDQASLLLALLRAASVNAHYIHGVVEVPLELLEQSLGLSGANQVQRALNRALRAHRPVLVGGTVTALELDYTWVVAYIPWSRYRGSAAFLTDRQCLSLDTALKPYINGAATGVLATAAIDTDALISEYLSQIVLEDPLSRLRTAVEQHLGASGSTQSFADQLAVHQLDTGALELLPASTAFKVLGVYSESAELPIALRSSVTLRADSGDGAVTSHTLSLGEALSSRLTLSFQPATWADQNLINEFGGLSQIPAYLVQVRPKLSVNGQTVAVGPPMALAQAVQLEVELSVAGQSTLVSQSVLSGAYAAVVLGQSGLMPESESAAAELEGEGPAARVLSNLGRRYSQDWNQDADTLADLIGVRTLQPLPSIAIVLSQLAVERVEGVPVQIGLDTIGLDAALRATEAISPSNQTVAEQQWLRLTALQGAVLERQIFDQQWAVPAVSGDRLLAEAALAGIPVLDLQGVSAAATVGTLNHSDAVKTAVINWLLAGYRVRIPESAHSVGAWHGSAWLVSDDLGSSGYFLSGGLAGGITVLPPDQWYVEDLARLLSDPYAPVPNLDPLSALYVRLDASAQDQMGVSGQTLPKPLGVRVEDGAGRPVFGALVRFTLEIGEGELTGGEGSSTSQVARTDHRGNASVQLNLGGRSSLVRFIEMEGSTELQEARLYQVNVSVNSRYGNGSISPGQPYAALGLPGPPDAILITSSPEPTPDFGIIMPAGIGYGTYRAAIVDQFGNGIANKNINLSVEWILPDVPPPAGGVGTCENIFEGGRGPAFFVPGQCPADKVIFDGSCEESALSLTSKSYGNTFHLVTSTVILSRSNITISAGGVDPVRIFTQTAGTGIPSHCLHPALGFFKLFVGQLVYDVSGRGHVHNQAPEAHYVLDRSDVIDGALPGEPMPQNRKLIFAWPGARTGVTYDAGGAVTRYQLGFPTGVYISGPSNNGTTVPYYPTNDDVSLSFEFSDGAVLEESGASAFQDGVLFYNVRMPASPGKVTGVGRLDVDNDHSDTCQYVPGSLVCEPYSPPIFDGDDDSFEFELADMWSIDPSLTNISPEIIETSLVGTAAQDLTATATTGAEGYVAGQSRFSLLEDGKEISTVTLPIVDGDTDVRFPRGWSVDLDKSYSLAMVVNEGTPFELSGTPRPISFASDVIAGTAAYSGDSDVVSEGELIALVLGNRSRDLTVTHTVDIPNQRVCTTGSELVFYLAQDAEVSLDLRVMTDQGDVSGTVERTLIDGDSRELGLHRVPVGLDQLPFGRYQYELRATGQSGDSETERGILVHTTDQRDHRALGHSIVKGVDVYDGQLSLSRTDATLAGRGPGLRFGRTYSSGLGDRPGPYGRGWSSLVDSHLSIDDCGVVQVVGGDGGGGRFVYDHDEDDGSVVYVPQDGYHSSLIRNANGEWDFYAVDGTRYRYAGSGNWKHKLRYVVDPSLNRVTFEYSQIASLWVVTGAVESSGRRLDLRYVEATVDKRQQPLLQVLTGPEGIYVNYEYDQNGNLVRVVRAGGISDDAIEIYTYQDFGSVPDLDSPMASHRVGWRISGVTNEINDAHIDYGQVLDWNYIALPNGGTRASPAYRITSITESDAGTVGFAYTGPRGQQLPISTRVTNARNYATTYAMNRYGGVTLQTDPVGSIQTVWNLTHRQPETVTDAEGVVTTYTYDDHGNTLSQTVSGNGDTIDASWGYELPDSFDPPFIKNRANSEIDFRGIASTLTYDLQGRLTGRSKGGVSETFSNAGNGDQVGHTDFNGNATTYSYDANGLRVGAVLADGSTRTATFDQRGRQRQSTDENGRSTRYTYDGHDRVTSTDYPGDGDPTRVYYNDVGRIRTETDELGRDTVFRLDHQGRVVSITNPEADSRTLTYDDHGNLLTETDFRGNQSISTYDAGDRRDSLSEPEGRSTSYSYDAVGNVLEMTVDGAGGPRTVRYAYDHPRYFKTGEYGALDDENVGNTYELDGEGGVLSMTDALDRVTTYTLDPFGRPLTMAEHGLRTTTYSYDAIGNRTSETVSGAGGARTRTHEFDSRNREIGMTDRSGAEWSRGYDGKRNLTSLTDPLGRVANYEYDARDRLTLQTLPGENRAYSYGYDAVGNRTSESKPSGQNLTHSYDALNRLTASSDQLGTVASFEYDEDGNATRYTDGREQFTIATYNGLSQKLTEARPLSRNLSWTWSVHGEVLTETDARDYTTTHAYDSLGRRTSSTDPLGTRSWAIDAIGNIRSETDRLDRITTYTYDALDRRETQTDPSPPATTQSWTYSAVDEVLTHTDRRSIQTKWTYDGEGRVKTEVRAGITMAINDYDDAGQRTSLTDALNRVTSFDYDPAGRWIKETRPEGAIRTRTWWPTDDPKSETDADGITVNWSYDVRRRLENESNALAEITTHEYDANGNRTGTIRPLENAWTYEFDQANRLEAVVDPLTNRTEYEYDAGDNRKVLRDANAHERKWNYDQLGRPVRMEYPDSAAETTTVDAEGNPVLTVRANAQRIERDFDGLNRLIEERFDPVNEDGIQTIHYSYDGNGNPELISETLTDGQRGSTYAYDDFDRLLSMTDRNGRTVSYRYDLVGNRTERTGPEGRTDYSYNDLDQLVSVTPPNGSAIVLTPSKAGRWGEIAHTNGTRTEVSYDPAGRTNGVRHWLGAAAVVLASYGFDANGNRATETIEAAGQTWETTYRYDLADRLEGYTAPEGVVDYQLDPVGNRTQENRDGAISNHSYDPRDRLTQTRNPANVVLASYSYDPAGRQISQTLGGSTTHYGYSAKDRMTSIRQGSTAATPVVEYEYDPQGQRSARVNSASREEYQWDGHDLAARTNAVGNVLGSYTNANGWTLASIEGPDRYTYHLDALGTPLALTGAAGGIAVRYRADPWGKPLDQSGPHPNPIGFTGYVTDPETDQLYAQARQYTPGVGRFSSVDEWEGDPLRPLSLNQYLYGFGNPGIYVDPDGQQSVSTEASFARGREFQKPEDLEAYDRNVARFLAKQEAEQAGTIQGLGEFTEDSIVAIAGLARDSVAQQIELLTGGFVDLGGMRSANARLSAVSAFVSNDPIESIRSGIENREAEARSLEIAGDHQGASRVRAKLSAEILSAGAGGAGLLRAGIKSFAKLRTASGTVVETTSGTAPKSAVWERDPRQRGVDVEDALAETDYKDWFRVGGLNKGYFPAVDFQKGQNLVSLKTVDTGGGSWMGRMQDHIRELSLGHKVEGKAANVILDMRVQPGGAGAAESLIEFGSKRGVTVRVSEYP